MGFVYTVLSYRHTPLWIALLVHLVYFSLGQLLGNHFLVDSYGYLFQSQNLTEYGSWYAEDWNAPMLIDYFSFRPPLYAAFIGIVQLVIPQVWGILLIQNIMSCVALKWAVNIARNEGASGISINLGLLSLLLLAPTYVIMANMVMAETLFCFLIMAAMYVAYQNLQQPSVKSGVYIGLLCVGALLTKPVAILFPLSLLLVLVWTHRKQLHIVLKPIIPVLLFPALAFHFVCMQQQHQTGYYHFSSIGAITQQRYHAKHVLANRYGLDSADSWNEACKIRYNATLDYASRLRLMQHQGGEVLLTYPFTFLKLYLKGIATFFLDPGRHDVFVFWGWEENEKRGWFQQSQSHGIHAITASIGNMPIAAMIVLALSFIMNIATIGGFLIFIYNTKGVLKLLACVVILYFAFTTGMLGVARYRTVIFPLLVVALSISIHTLHHRFWLHARH